MISVLLLLTAVVGAMGNACAARRLVEQAGKRIAINTSFESIRRHERQYAILSTVNILDRGSLKVLRTENEVLVITLPNTEAKIVHKKPDWYDKSVEMHMRSLAQGAHAPPTTQEQEEEAFIDTSPPGYHPSSASLVVRAREPSGELRVVFTVGGKPKPYREDWGLLVEIIGTPLALVFDVVTSPIQGLIVLTQLSKIH